jgi:hypothetical protein
MQRSSADITPEKISGRPLTLFPSMDVRKAPPSGRITKKGMIFTLSAIWAVTP